MKPIVEHVHRRPTKADFEGKTIKRFVVASGVLAVFLGWLFGALTCLWVFPSMGQTRDEMRAMEGRTGVTRENACFLLRLQLRPCDGDREEDNRRRTRNDKRSTD